MIEKIVSGGQTGVDRAALDVAIELDIPCGGWCPRGRLAEDGPIDDTYPLTQTPSADYTRRTEWNVRDSDATLVLTIGEPTGGTALTVSFAKSLGRPCLLLDLSNNVNWPEVARWFEEHAVCVLNVAGPRASSLPEIYDLAAGVLRRLIAEACDDRADRLTG